MPNVFGFNKADASSLVEMIENRQGPHPDWDEIVRTQNAATVFRTPTGGISARSGDTLGNATCTKITVNSGTREVTAVTKTVYNHFLGDIGGDRDIIAVVINGIWVAIAEDCSEEGTLEMAGSGAGFDVVGGASALSYPDGGVYEIVAEQAFFTFDLNGSGSPLEPV